MFDKLEHCDQAVTKCDQLTHHQNLGEVRHLSAQWCEKLTLLQHFALIKEVMLATMAVEIHVRDRNVCLRYH